MSNRPAVEVIDLTDSFTLANHCGLSNVIIELDDSVSDFNSSVSQHINDTPALNLLENTVPVSDDRCSVGNRKSKGKKSLTSVNKKPREPTLPKKRIASDKNRSSGIFGDCPICWDELGKNPLASTKCGHVYCLKCIQQSLRTEKKCPTCRTALRGSTAFHPLYLARD